MALKIRPVEKADFEQVLAMWRSMMEESPVYRLKKFDEKRARDILNQMLMAWVNPLLGIVAEDNGRIVGMLGAAVRERFFDGSKYSTDFAVYVVPELRGSSAAIRLIKAYEKWADSKGVLPEDIMLGVSTGVEMERTVRVYERLGYMLVSYGMARARTE